MDRKPALVHQLRPEDTSRLAAAVETLKRDRALIYQYNREMAAVIRNEYEEYVAAGFTTAQAMKLVAAKLTPSAK